MLFADIDEIIDGTACREFDELAWWLSEKPKWWQFRKRKKWKASAPRNDWEFTWAFTEEEMEQEDKP